jgi:hypothetical protein
MVKLYHIIFTLTLTVIFSTQTPAQASVFESLSSALHSGNTTKITHYMDNVVYITIDNKQYAYSKAQANMVLEKFFNKNIPSTYELQYVGQSPNKNITYGIGELLTANNGRYRVYLLIKTKPDHSDLLQEIKFER